MRLVKLSACLFFTIGAILISCLNASAAEQRPNIVVVLVDDMGYSDSSPYGGEIFTPNIATLASQGAMFSDFSLATTESSM